MRWTEDATILYAIGVGAGQADPTGELHLTSEVSRTPLQALPTMAAALLQFNVEAPEFGAVSLQDIVHADQTVTLQRPLPASGELDVTQRVVGLLDKGRGAIVQLRAEGRSPGDGSLVVATDWSLYVQGAGGWGGERGTTEPWSPGEEAPTTVEFSTRPEQGLIYRLSGDRNPLHIDPDFARDAGFERPILHGLATYGYAVRLLLGRPGWSPADVSVVSARFAAPVAPGEPLELLLWETAKEIRFRVRRPDGTTVIDRGLLGRAGAPDGDDV